ncbi:lactonase family protein [Bombilactobacillus folatiphilus]|uniref:Lactonase family protein n=1 Tax=Bombilactobacillus folatiphilus TaxID=2923362 RepID=A0ABY4P7Y4_9LACO|nr:lactonase family protein [Bombilactobacillus folatiphilus]UQS81727.1 lactonase family protein [Bombilactobacillus folatiphilus]
MKEKLLIGGYTRQTSQGIYQMLFDTQSTTISNIKLAVPLQGPTYFAVSNDDVLYSIIQDGEQGGIAAYDINADFQFLGSALQPKDSPAYVEIAEQKQLVFSANFHTGIVTIHKINPDKTLTITDQIQLTGHSVKAEQEASHPHMAHLAPDDQLIVCDYGTDKISTYQLNDDGQAHLQAEFQAPAGSAPRHLVFNPQNPQLAYCICELSSQVLVLNYLNGQFSLVQAYNLLPANYLGENTAAAIRISADGQYLYTSNRGHNSIVSFRIAADGQKLEHLQTIKTQGDFPRDFSLDPSGQFILVPHQKSNDVSILRRNLDSGQLTFVNNEATVPEGTCLKFFK